VAFSVSFPPLFISSASINIAGFFSPGILSNVIYERIDLTDEGDVIDCSNFCLNIEKGRCDMFTISVSAGFFYCVKLLDLSLISNINYLTYDGRIY